VLALVSSMQLLVIVFRNSLEPDVRPLLQALGVDAFTAVPKVIGVGAAGKALDSFTWPGFNSIVLAAVSDGEADRVVGGLAAFRDRAAERQHGAEIPLRVFALPCRQAV
jgi:hypothetical protein